MRRVFRIVMAGVACSAVSALASGNNHGDANSSTPVAHHSSSAPTTTTAVAPRLNSGAMPHYSKSIGYRPSVTYPNGNRTLNYPAVGVSNTRHPTYSNLKGLNGNARALRHGSGNSQSGVANSQSSTGSLQRSGGNAQHAGAINIAGKHRLDPQSSARLRNWNGNVSSTAQAHQNHLNNFHHHHDHHWWRHHCLAFIFFDWGWWGWYDGWWYPAWGYDAYSYYPYNEPIYGTGDLSPEQIVASVQVALQEQGYYQYAIDGRMGPLTRAAIARYQSDHRLPITSGIDPATLGSLGIIR